MQVRSEEPRSGLPFVCLDGAQSQVMAARIMIVRGPVQWRIRQPFVRVTGQIDRLHPVRASDGEQDVAVALDAEERAGGRQYHRHQGEREKSPPECPRDSRIHVTNARTEVT